MLLEIFYRYKNEHNHALRDPLRMIRPLDSRELFYHCCQTEELEESDWYLVEELLKAHGVVQFSIIDRTTGE